MELNSIWNIDGKGHRDHLKFPYGVRSMHFSFWIFENFRSISILCNWFRNWQQHQLPQKLDLFIDCIVYFQLHSDHFSKQISVSIEIWCIEMAKYSNCAPQTYFHMIANALCIIIKLLLFRFSNRMHLYICQFSKSHSHSLTLQCLTDMHGRY